MTSTVVYKVSGPFTNNVYYGYSSAGSERDTFLAGCNRSDSEESNRGDRRMLDANKCSETTLKFEMMDEFDDEFEAWCMRNDLRASDARSITGPTMFPTTAFTRVQKEQPTRVAKWSKLVKQNKLSSALEAYQAGAYTFAQISALSAQYGKEYLTNSLAKLTPAEFSTQFGL